MSPIKCICDTGTREKGGFASVLLDQLGAQLDPLLASSESMSKKVLAWMSVCVPVLRKLVTPSTLISLLNLQNSSTTAVSVQQMMAETEERLRHRLPPQRR